MAKGTRLKDLMEGWDALDKQATEQGDKVNKSKVRKKIAELAETMAANVPPSGIISREYTKNPDVVITKTMANDIKSIKGLQQALLKEARETNGSLAALTKITVGGIKQSSEFMEANSKFIESNQELISRLLMNQELARTGATVNVGKGGGEDRAGKESEGMSRTGLGLVGAAIAGLLPFIGDLKDYVEKFGMWILDVPKSIENSFIFGANRIASSISKAIQPAGSFFSTVKEALFPSKVDNPPKTRTTVEPDRAPTAAEPDRAPTNVEPDRAPTAAEPDRAPTNVEPERTTQIPDEPNRAPTAAEPDRAPSRRPARPTAGAGTAATETTEALVKRKTGIGSIAKYVAAKAAQKALKLVPVAGAGLALWDGLAAFSAGDWHRVGNNVLMGGGSLLEATGIGTAGIGTAVGAGVGAIGLMDSILHDIYSELYTNEDGSPADYLWDLTHNNALAKERLKDIIPVVSEEVAKLVKEQASKAKGYISDSLSSAGSYIADTYSSITDSVGGFLNQPMRPFTNNPRGAGARTVAPRDTSGDYNGEITAEEAARSMLGRSSSPSHRTPLPPTPVQRMTAEQMNNIAMPTGQMTPNITINKGGDVVNNVVQNRGNAGGGSAGVSGSPSRVPSPFDYLLYGDTFNWGY